VEQRPDPSEITEAEKREVVVCIGRIHTKLGPPYPLRTIEDSQSSGTSITGRSVRHQQSLTQGYRLSRMASFIGCKFDMARAARLLEGSTVRAVSA
jgi:hypothetical protein